MPLTTRAGKGSQLSHAELDANVSEIGAAGSDVASAATTTIGSAACNSLTVTGSVGITSFGTSGQKGMVRILVFAGAPLITHHATNLILPGGLNLQIAAGDVLAVRKEHATNAEWRCVGYVPASGRWPSVRLPNLIVDGCCQVAQGATKTLSGSAQYGSVDMWAVWASAGTPSAGTITQDTAYAGSSTGFALKLASATATGSAVISMRQRIDSKRARLYKNRTVSISAVVQHDVGSAINYTLIVRKPTALDNYTSTTTIHTSSATSVPSGAATTIKTEAVAIGDITNGVEIEIQAACGAITTKNFWVSDIQIVEGAVAPAFVPQLFSESYWDCLEYFAKTFNYATAPAQNAGTPGWYNWSQQLGASTSQISAVSWTYPREMRAAPTLTLYNPSATNAQIRNVAVAGDWSASSIAGGTKSASPGGTSNAGSAAGNSVGVHITADARL